MGYGESMWRGDVPKPDQKRILWTIVDVGDNDASGREDLDVLVWQSQLEAL